jgi:hypothetical protein
MKVSFIGGTVAFGNRKVKVRLDACVWGGTMGGLRKHLRKEEIDSKVDYFVQIPLVS